MTAWPENGTENWNDPMKEFVLAEHNTNGTHAGKISAIAAKAYLSANQNVNVTAKTVVELDTSLFDTDSIIDTDNNRIKPTTAGYYHVDASIRCSSIGSGKTLALTIGKNGTDNSVNGTRVSSEGAGGAVSRAISDVIHCNGSSDYIDISVTSSDGSYTVELGSDETYLTVSYIGA